MIVIILKHDCHHSHTQLSSSSWIIVIILKHVYHHPQTWLSSSSKMIVIILLECPISRQVWMQFVTKTILPLIFLYLNFFSLVVAHHGDLLFKKIFEFWVSCLSIYLWKFFIQTYPVQSWNLKKKQSQNRYVVSGNRCSVYLTNWILCSKQDSDWGSWLGPEGLR